MAVDLPTLIAIRRRMENLRGFSRLGFRAQRVRPFRVSVSMRGQRRGDLAMFEQCTLR